MFTTGHAMPTSAGRYRQRHDPQGCTAPALTIRRLSWCHQMTPRRHGLDVTGPASVRILSLLPHRGQRSCAGADQRSQRSLPLLHGTRRMPVLRLEHYPGWHLARNHFGGTPRHAGTSASRGHADVPAGQPRRLPQPGQRSHRAVNTVSGAWRSEGRHSSRPPGYRAPRLTLCAGAFAGRLPAHSRPRWTGSTRSGRCGGQP